MQSQSMALPSIINGVALSPLNLHMISDAGACQSSWLTLNKTLFKSVFSKWSFFSKYTKSTSFTRKSFIQLLEQYFTRCTGYFSPSWSRTLSSLTWARFFTQLITQFMSTEVLWMISFGWWTWVHSQILFSNLSGCSCWWLITGHWVHHQPQRMGIFAERHHRNCFTMF